MKQNHKIKKLDGEYEKFSVSKLRQSIINSGASESSADRIINQLINQIEPVSTAQIHHFVYQRLANELPQAAARYSLKKALHSLGPTGYSFEKYIAAIYRELGYITQINQILKGSCVQHEMDVIARKNNELLYIECKYHESQAAKSNIKIPLYVKARTDDLFEFQKSIEQPDTQFKFMIATNTKFTKDAIQYAQCKGLNLLGWEQPAHMPLQKIIDRHGLHPVTVMTTLTKRQAHRLIESGVVMVKDIPNRTRELLNAGIAQTHLSKVESEAEAIMTLE